MAYSVQVTKNGQLGKYAGRWTPIWTSDGVTLDYDFKNSLGWIENSVSLESLNTPETGFTFSRTSLATYFDATGRLVTVSDNSIRYYFDQETKENLGILLESESTNRILRNRDLTSSSWVKSNIVAQKDQIGLDARQNSASSIRATAANAYVYQTFSVPNNTRISHVYLKRVSGSGKVWISQRSLSDLTQVTVGPSWARVVTPSYTFSSGLSTFVIKLERKDDVIAVDFCQSESSAIPTSPIEVFDTAVTRQAETITFNTSGWFNTSQGTLVVEYKLIDELVPFDGAFLNITDETEDNFIKISSLATDRKIRTTFQSSTTITQFSIPVGDYALSGRVVVSWDSEIENDPDVPSGMTSMILGTVQPDDGEFYWAVSRVYYDPRITDTTEFEGLA